MVQQQAGALGVRAERGVEVVPRHLRNGEVEHVVEIGGQLAEVGIAEIDGERPHTDCLDLGPRLRVAEPGDAPDLVVLRHVASHREGDLAGRSGDEDLLVAEHDQPLKRSGKQV